MHSYATNTTATAQQRKAAKINAVRKHYAAAKKQGLVKISLSAEEAQKRANRSVFRLS